MPYNSSSRVIGYGYVENTKPIIFNNESGKQNNVNVRTIIVILHYNIPICYINIIWLCCRRSGMQNWKVYPSTGVTIQGLETPDIVEETFIGIRISFHCLHCIDIRIGAELSIFPAFGFVCLFLSRSNENVPVWLQQWRHPAVYVFRSEFISRKLSSIVLPWVPLPILPDQWHIYLMAFGR